MAALGKPRSSRIGVAIKNDTEEIALVSNRAEILALKRVILF